MLADRYRFVALLGRGGMGEVYRADDLKLGQSVALKFLPHRFVSDPERLSRFMNEVRTARTVTHPNVCRVYDVGEADGEHFLSMEFVQGEDLATLLRRIGRLPGDKALQIARQICAGLAAAHERGVIHRDLKPANVMLDERGTARITDFGLAGAVEDFQGESAREGTPAYMAPEQLAGRHASARSDVYSLGLLLYELFTGKPAFSAETATEMLRVREQTTPANPSSHVSDMDPAVERAILRCLESEPLKRPGTAALVAAALPGGDPLAAAIAAGETPSPEMVAAAGSDEGMKPAPAWACLVLILAGLALAAYLSPRAYRHGHVPLEKPPEALAERAKEIIRRFGYTEKPVGTAWGFSGNGEYRGWVEEHDKSKNRWKDMEDGRPAAIYFWYRQSPGQLIPERFRGEDFGAIQVTESDPPPETSGMVGVELDPLGRLIRFEAVPSSGPQASSAALDWSILLAEAGLDATLFSPAEPQWFPPSYADTRAAWAESKPARPGRPLRIEAASALGRLVFFELAGPWSRLPRMALLPELTGVRRDFPLLILSILVVGGALIARRNLRLGRSDRRGAMRLAAFVFAGSMLTWAFMASHVASDSELALLLLGASIALFLAGVCWLMYVALEPLIRRRWPDSLIAWTRLLSGRFSDPLVGRVLLAGALLGIFGAVSGELRELARRAFEATPPIPPFPWDTTLRGPRAVASHLVNPAVAMFFALAEALLFFLLRAVLRKEWLAAPVFVLIQTLPSVLIGGPISGAFSLVVSAAFIFVFLRFGLLAWVVANYFGHFLQFPLTTDSSSWYAGTSLFLLLVLAALTIFGFRIALAGRPMFSGASLDD
jgi:serine/threonine-protein kinase